MSRTIVLDACCLINLAASGELASVVSTLGGAWEVPPAAAGEALFVRELQDGQESKLPLDLDAYVAQGCLTRVACAGEAELAAYTRLAIVLDDGEATALAIAAQRGWVLATDDRVARAPAGELGVAVESTAALMRAWATTGSIAAPRLALALQQIRLRARFMPRTSDPDYAWWLAAAKR